MDGTYTTQSFHCRFFSIPSCSTARSQVHGQTMATVRLEMALQTRTLDTLPEDQGSVPRTLHGASNHVYLQFQWIRHPLLASMGTAHTGCTYIQAKHQYTYNFKNCKGTFCSSFNSESKLMPLCIIKLRRQSIRHACVQAGMHVCRQASMF